MGRTLCIDPGETVGWSIWRAGRLLGGGQTPMGLFKLDVWDAVADNEGPLAEFETEHLHKGVTEQDNCEPFRLFVIEKFALYPDKAKSLYWDEFRTSQLIGALTFIAEKHFIEIHKQPAFIKERAKAGGAQELFVKPLHENRHQNDSIMHGFFYSQVVEKNIKLNIPDGTIKGA